ncbi:hypothetical protein AGMMS49543_20870 [Betaproteobacteria bacterium]|nr:hypothetical protein AGMMS49543_20870 [Betaproteobacteria bacterium]
MTRYDELVEQASKDEQFVKQCKESVNDTLRSAIACMEAVKERAYDAGYRTAEIEASKGKWPTVDEYYGFIKPKVDVQKKQSESQSLIFNALAISTVLRRKKDSEGNSACSKAEEIQQMQYIAKLHATDGIEAVQKYVKEYLNEQEEDEDECGPCDLKEEEQGEDK